MRIIPFKTLQYQIREGSRLVVRQVRDKQGSAIIRAVQAQRLTYLEANALFDLRARTQEIEAKGIVGSVIEAGCALGGSAIVLAASKRPQRSMFVYDVFGMIPPPSEKDGADVTTRYAEISSGGAEGIGGDRYYGYEKNLLDQVEASFTRNGLPIEANTIEFMQGLFDDTLRPEGPVALAHIDGDWYDSVAVCLARIWPKLSVGGVVVIDDYDHWSGCHSAVDDFLRDREDVKLERHARLHLVKTR